MANEGRILIYFDDVVNALTREYGKVMNTHIYSPREILDTIGDLHPVDAVEVPCRCKECKYWKHYDHLGCTEFVKVCTLAYYMIGENGYCLYGERSEGE